MKEQVKATTFLSNAVNKDNVIMTDKDFIVKPKILCNPQIVTTWEDKQKKRIKTILKEKAVSDIDYGEILVEMKFVPIHGSFWLASHPHGLHPRRDEILIEDSFVFGNGGVGKVIDSRNRYVNKGDYVCIFGHLPCNNYDCYSCTVLHRYTECEYNEGKIIGHGKHSPDGTYAKYVILQESSYEVCFKHNENPTQEQLKAFMFGFLLADVRNALTRNQSSSKKKRMALFGAGYSGLAAAYLQNKICPDLKIFVADSSKENLKNLKKLNPENIRTFLIPSEQANILNDQKKNPNLRKNIQSFILEMRDKMIDHFGGKKCDILFDASSGNTSPLWDNKYILNSYTHCIPFGFGSENVQLNKDIIQMSGLQLIMSRGVGSLANRKTVVELIKSDTGSFINNYMVNINRQLNGLKATIKFINEMQIPPRPLHELEHAYINFG